MMAGISTNRRCESSASCLFENGIQFVFRYHSRTTTQPEKRLHPKEAAELARAGVSIAAVYQDRARQAGDFGAQRGVEDAISALHYAGQVGQPADSAVYFAVDTDFSATEINAVVVPYFLSIERIFSEAGNGTPYLRIGVYGSGLTCRLVGGMPFVTYRWLAESTGWRESKTYQAWTVKQSRNAGQALCNLASAFETCEAKEVFGDFKPVGFQVQEGQGTVRRVVSGGGNLRHMPSTKFNDAITLLPGGHELFALGSSAPGWLRVRTKLGGGTLIGHIAESRLMPEGAVAVPLVEALAPTKVAAPGGGTSLPAAHLREDNPDSARNLTSGRAYPLGESARKTRTVGASPDVRVSELTAIADWLDVERSARYARTPTNTYCNVYAADYCYLAGIYLPRVWWKESAIVQIAQGAIPQVLYDSTVRELRADDLYAWLSDVGQQFGWRRVFDATALQDAANNGGIGLICADRAQDGKPGHISIVVPEDGQHRAKRDVDGNVEQPLQSQAGGTNHRYGSAGKDWWKNTQVFKARGFFIHD